MGVTPVTRLEGVSGLFLALTWIFTALRVYVRCAISKSWGADDSLLIAALITFTAYVCSTLAGIPYGIGHLIVDVKIATIPQALMLWWLSQLFYIISTVFLRCSIAVFILRICAKRSHKIVIYTTIIVVIAFSTFYFFLAVFQCNPVNYYWTRYSFGGQEGTCLDPKIFVNASYAHSAVSASADWVLGSLPLWLIWDLKLDFRSKLSVGLLLSFGMIAGIAAIIRVPFIHIIASTDEFFYTIVDVAIWSTVEPGLGIIATAACVLRPLTKRFGGLYTYGTRNTKTHTSTRYHERVNTNSKKTFPNGSKSGCRFQDGIEMESVVVSVLGNHKDRSKWNSVSVQVNARGSESEERLTREEKGITVYRTVDVQTHDATPEQSKANSISTVGSEAE